MTAQYMPSDGLQMTHALSSVVKHCFINVPFDRLAHEYLELVRENRLRPEIGLEGDILYDTPRREFERLADILQEAGLTCTLHAPFGDLNPGAGDRYIRTVSRDKLRMAFGLIPVFKPAAIVCHLGYEEHKHGYHREQWFQTALETWRELLGMAEKHRTVLMLENTYETGPEMHRRTLAALDSKRACFCLDTGHLLAFAGTSWQEWLPALAPWLGQLHLHDNHGDRDSHLPIGTGHFDFTGLFQYLRDNGLSPLATLEPHREEDLWPSLRNLAAFSSYFTNKETNNHE